MSEFFIDCSLAEHKFSVPFLSGQWTLLWLIYDQLAHRCTSVHNMLFCAILVRQLHVLTCKLPNLSDSETLQDNTCGLKKSYKDTMQKSKLTHHDGRRHKHKPKLSCFTLNTASGKGMCYYAIPWAFCVVLTLVLCFKERVVGNREYSKNYTA